MNEPGNPLEAVTHPDPYPYYSRLAAARPFDVDHDLGVWVAASHAAVKATLASPLVRVRPASEPVPVGLVGSPAGDVFSRLIRMNDGPFHAAVKPVVTSALDALSGEKLDVIARRQAGRVLLDDPTAFAFAYPAAVLGEWLGLDDATLDAMTVWVHDFARAIAPATTPEQMARGGSAAGNLVAKLGAGRPLPFGGVDQDVATANAIGFLFQAYDATAGLIGNTLLALGGVGPAAGSATPLPDLVRQVSRLDPSIQNTRRYVFEDGEIAGRRVRAGDTILVALAAANHDPAADDEKFNQSFGSGPHACPGQRIALAIATVGVEALLNAGVDPAALVDRYRYLPSANARIPVFDREEQPA